MANNAIFGGGQWNRTSTLPNALPNTFGKRRVLVWSGDKLPTDSNYSINISLSEPLSQVVYAEWVTCSIPGYCFQVNQFPNLGRTSQHSGSTQYWRFIGALTNSANYSASPYPDNQWNPTSISRLSINVFNPDGSTPTSLGAGWMLELDCWFINDGRQ